MISEILGHGIGIHQKARPELLHLFLGQESVRMSRIYQKDGLSEPGIWCKAGSSPAIPGAMVRVPIRQGLPALLPVLAVAGLAICDALGGHEDSLRRIVGLLPLLGGVPERH